MQAPLLNHGPEQSALSHLLTVRIGEHCYGKYIYIPTWNIATDISHMEDRFWNQEHLMRTYPELSPVDVISIVEALVAIKKHSC